MGPVRQNPIQRTVRTAHLSVLMSNADMTYVTCHSFLLDFRHDITTFMYNTHASYWCSCCELVDSHALSMHRSGILVLSLTLLPAYTRITFFARFSATGMGFGLYTGRLNIAYMRVYMANYQPCSTILRHQLNLPESGTGMNVMFFALVSFADLLFTDCAAVVYTTSNGASSNNITYAHRYTRCFNCKH